MLSPVPTECGAVWFSALVWGTRGRGFESRHSDVVRSPDEYINRRAKIIEYLGGSCARCSAVTDLDCDHIDPSAKTFTIGQRWWIAWDELVVELDKCQLLCRPHHLEKSRENGELGGGHNKWSGVNHGKVWAYNKYKCRCEECRAVKSQARALEERRRRGRQPHEREER